MTTQKGLSLLIFASVILITGCSHHVTTLNLKDVTSVELTPAHGGAGGKTIPLLLNVPHDRAIVEKIVNWVNDSTVTSDGKDQFFSFGGNPTELTIKLQDGNIITLESATGSKATKLPNGGLVQSVDKPGQVYVFNHYELSRADVDAPDLKEWLAGGWKQDISSFTAADAIAKYKSNYVSDFPDEPGVWQQIYRNIGGRSENKIPMDVETLVEPAGDNAYILTFKEKWNSSAWSSSDSTNKVLTHQSKFKVTSDSITSLGESGDREPDIP